MDEVRRRAHVLAQVLRLRTFENLKRVEGELEWFTLKFDYRNADKPWGNSRNALERTVNRLRSKCIDSENG